MTTKELINQYVTAHADNRWMDASELETLLTEFAEKLQEPASEDLAYAINNYCLKVRKGYPRVKDETDLYICEAFKAGVVWQEKQMMKDAVIGILDCDDNGSWIELECNIVSPSKAGDKVKVIIISNNH